ncbi:DUF2188 domain-containing protein [Myroides sp. M-43]|uniref:DUF2188 domain-containing protein n=1 Tax=Myroides oncorhynchi TaxID=2893756 RepID=UPI001E36100C|nr:DUF2188 domain-containing protein [Myroides oncorhynchi]MCC9043304.1 DUF2188 domain-containing protein [Myroides oncorhynchi]
MKKYTISKIDGRYQYIEDKINSYNNTNATNKKEAIKIAKNDIINNGGGSLKIKKLDGKFQEERTYPKSIDPIKSKG